MMFWTKLEQVVVWACLIERGGGAILWEFSGYRAICTYRVIELDLFYTITEREVGYLLECVAFGGGGGG